MKVNLTLAEIKNIIGVPFESSDNSVFIKDISSLENASPDDISFVFNRGSESVFDNISNDIVKASNAKIIVVSKKIWNDKRFLVVNDPLDAFNRLVNHLRKPLIYKKPKFIFIDETADIHSTVNFGNFTTISSGSSIKKGVFLGSNVFIGKNVRIGENSYISDGVKILDECIIGDNVIIHPNVVIGSDGFGYSVSNNGLLKIPQIGIVRIGNNVEIGANTTIDRAAMDETVIGDGCKIDNLVQIAHNVKIGSHSVILAQTGIAGGVSIGNFCQIGGQVAIKDHVNIGNNVKIVSKSGILKDIKDNAIVAGIPAIEFRKWKRLTAILFMLPDYIKKFKNNSDQSKRSTWKRILNFIGF